MSKIFRIFILMILLLLLSMAGCVNDLKSAQGQPETTNQNVDEPIDNIAEFLGDIES